MCKDLNKTAKTWKKNLIKFSFRIFYDRSKDNVTRFK